MNPLNRAATPSSGFFSTMLLCMFFIPLLSPFVNATGMQSCQALGGTCDDYDHADDLTPNNQDWVEGTYDFTLASTSSINLVLNWAVREFDREAVGLGPNTTLGAGLESAEGLDPNDGIPADLIRESFNQDPDGDGVTVGNSLKTEVNDAIQDALTSGFGTVTSMSTDYTSSFGSTTCSIDNTNDALAEGAPVNNVFEPPVCFQAIASVQLSASQFNLVGSDQLDLERTYQGLLTMGAEINTDFQLTTQPGHRASFAINPPTYSTVLAVDDNGTLAHRAGTPSFSAAEWSMDHLNATETDTNLVQSVGMTMGHRNTSGTPTVWVDNTSKALDLNIVLDLRDESAATVEFVAGLYYLDEQTLSDWGINMFAVSQAASIPLITSDGIRLAYHNGIVDLTNFTSQFPVTDIVEGIGDTVAGVGDIEMSELQWVSSTTTTGAFEQDGGLNYSHTTGCSEPVAVDQDLHYCLEGQVAMDATYPVYLQTTSQPFSMSLIDILQEYNSNDMIDGFLDGVQQRDLERLMNAGLSLETVINSSYLDTIVPSNLPPSELTVEIRMPSWVVNNDGGSSIFLQKTIQGTQETNVSFRGTTPYNWEHEITNDDDQVLCYANQSTCISSAIDFDWSEFNLNEWSQSVSFTFSLEAEVSIYRVGLPLDQLPQNGDTRVQMDAIPSDLVRLLIDLSSRMDEPLTSGEFELCDPEDSDLSICDESVELTATRQGMKDFATQMGDLVTAGIHDFGDLAEENDSVSEMDLSNFFIQTKISGIEAPDEVVSDEEPITLTITIPEVEFTIGVEADFNKVQNGDMSGLKLSVVTDTLQSMFVQPLRIVTDAFTHGLTASVVSGDGVTYPPTGQDKISLSTGVVNTTVMEENNIAVTGPVTFTLPRGVELVGATSSSGNLVIREDGGRQTITYTIPPGEFEDDISFSVRIGWVYFAMQFWIYPTIVFVLLFLMVRRFRRRRKNKKKRLAKRQENVDKAQFSDSQFADLTGFSSPALRKGESIEDMATVDEY